jgi:hypothetical protein
MGAFSFVVGVHQALGGGNDTAGRRFQVRGEEYDPEGARWMRILVGNVEKWPRSGSTAFLSLITAPSFSTLRRHPSNAPVTSEQSCATDIEDRPRTFVYVDDIHQSIDNPSHR